MQLQSSNYKDKHGSYVTMPYKVVTTRTYLGAILLCPDEVVIYKDKHGSYVTMPNKVVTTRTDMAAL